MRRGARLQCCAADLLAAGVIDEPYYRFNDVAYQWIALDSWTYTREFTLSAAELSSASRVVLSAEGLDTVATVSVNGIQVLSSDNMFVRQWVDVTTALRAGSNFIEIAFESTVGYAEAQFQAFPVVPGTVGLPPICPPDIQNGFCHPNFVRTSPLSFSWDFAPAFAPMGIFRSLSLVASDVYVRDITVVTTPSTSPVVENGQWALGATAYVYSSGAVSASTCTAKLARHGRVLASDAVNSTLVSGEFTPVSFELAVTDVSLWWPNGYGAAVLYDLSVWCGRDGEASVRVGFRTAELVQEPIGAEGGRTFYFAINGVPMFLKGANFVPADAFESRVTTDYLEYLFDSYIAAHYNVLRVWGGGLYQRDVFYDLADQYGLLIWQETMFACSMYNAEPAFLANVASEVVDNILRLQSHPSIFVWSANNENEAAIAENWYATANETAYYTQLYVDLYWDTVLATIAAVDDSRPRLSSSPSNGNETAERPIAANPASELFGDLHYYSYITDCWDISSYPSPRFASEFGFQSFPSFLSMANVSSQADGDWAYDSAFSNHRQHHPNGTQQIMLQISYHYPPPAAGTSAAESYANFLLLSQISHAMCIKTEAEHYRRGRSSATGPMTMGTMYWQANDVWQGASWSSIEYGGRWKVLHYYATQFYAPVLVSAYSLTGTDFVLMLVNDNLVPLTGSVKLSMWSWAGTAPLAEWQEPLDAPANDAYVVLNGTMAQLLADGRCPSPTECVLSYAAFDSAGTLLNANVMYLSSFSMVTTFVDPQLVVSEVSAVQGSRTDFVITVHGVALAPFVWLETPIAGRFSTNGGLFVPSTLTVVFYAVAEDVSAVELQASLSVRSLWDVTEIGGAKAQ